MKLTIVHRYKGSPSKKPMFSGPNRTLKRAGEILYGFEFRAGFASETSFKVRTHKSQVNKNDFAIGGRNRLYNCLQTDLNQEKREFSERAGVVSRVSTVIIEGCILEIDPDRPENQAGITNEVRRSIVPTLSIRPKLAKTVTFFLLGCPR